MLVWCVAAMIATQGAPPTETIGLPAPPPRGQYIVDEASLLDSASRATIDSIGRARAAIGLPVYVLTIHSVASHDSSGTTFDELSRRTFKAWSASRAGGESAAMIVVSAEDKLARIEGGPRWAQGHDSSLKQIMSDALEPALASGSLDQGLVLATYETTWALKPPEVSLWLRDALTAGAVILGGVLLLGFLRRRRAVPAAEPAPVEEPRAASEIEPALRASQRMQAISEARQHSRKAAASIRWLEVDDGESGKGGKGGNG